MAERVSLKRGQVPKAVARKAARPAPRRAAEPIIRLPLGPKLMRAWLGAGIGMLVAAGGVAALWLAGIPQMAWFETARSTAEAGFEVRHVTINGLKYTDRLVVHEQAVSGPSNAMLLVGLDDVRARVMALPWVADASVRRELPDTLVVDVTERKPVALWQYRHRLALIDVQGRVLTRAGLARFGALPIVVGPRANLRTRELMTMLADQPALKQHVDSASWVGNRRWDLRFKSGEILALPEGVLEARKALGTFAGMDEKSGLLAKGFARFDMRLGDRMTVRTSGEPGASAAPRTAETI